MISSLLRPLNSGFQDERLQYDINPKRIRFSQFTKIFLRAGRMTTQWVRLDFNQLPDFGRQATLDLVRKGHFISRLFLVSTLPDIAGPQAAAAVTAAVDPASIYPKFGWTNSVGHALIANAQLTIAGDVVDQIDSQLFEILDELYTPLEKVPAVNELVARNDTNFGQTTFGYTGVQKTVYTPLPFWFCRGDSAAAFPIDAIAADQIQVRINFRAAAGCYYTDSRFQGTFDPQVDGAALWPLPDSQLYKTATKFDPGAQRIPGLIPNDPNQYFVPIQGAKMPSALHLGETYILAEYIYVDKPEANRFRVADLKVPIVQHYALEPQNNKGQAFMNIRIRVPNPARALYFITQRYEVSSYNAHFLMTRDLKAATPEAQIPWWPNSQGLQSAAVPKKFIPAFALRDSEPLSALTYIYEGNMARYATTSPSLFRSVMTGTIFKKSPWINRYIYALPFGLFPGFKPLTVPFGEANLDKLKRTELRLQIAPSRGCTNPMEVDRFIARVYVETYNILRIYGGRASLLFSY